MTVTVRSFAKINLGLHIGPPREDGFHELLTIYQTIGLHDSIRVNAGRGSGIEISCDDPRVPRDESNTCYKMAERVLAIAGESSRSGRVVIDIDKDAARRAYNRMFVAYLRTFARMGLKAIPMQADPGPIGGELSHEFILLADAGESDVFFNRSWLQSDIPVIEADYAADLEPTFQRWTAA